jgi:hypothetical protein
MNPEVYLIDDDENAHNLFAGIAKQQQAESQGGSSAKLGVDFKHGLDTLEKTPDECVAWCTEKIGQCSANEIVFFLDLNLNLKRESVTDHHSSLVKSVLGLNYAELKDKAQGFAIAAAAIQHVKVPEGKLVIWVIQTTGGTVPVPTLKDNPSHIFVKVNGNCLGIIASGLVNHVSFEEFFSQESDDNCKNLAKTIADICKNGTNSIVGTINKHRDYLKGLEETTRSWFTMNCGAGWNGFEDHGPPHNLPTGDNTPEDFLENYGACVLKAVPLLTLEAATIESLLPLHEALESFVGAYAEWMGGNLADRPLSLAGAYCLLLSAMHRRVPKGTDLSFLSIADWSCFYRRWNKDKDEYTREGLHRFLPRQEQDTARICVRLLFDIFSALATVKNAPEECGIAGFDPPTADKPWFRLKLNWCGLDKFSDKSHGLLTAALTDSLSPKVQSEEERSNSEVLPKGNLAGLMMRFALASQVSKAGFGAYGLLRLEKDTSQSIWLRVGGTTP